MMRLVFFSFAATMLAAAPIADADGPDARKPNILFAISDDQSFPHASAYGCQWVKTPAFDKVADRGLLFMNCYTPNAKCSPSRSIVATGRNSWQLGEAGNHVFFFPDKFKTYAEALTGHSEYFVGSTGKGVDPVIVENRHLAGQPYAGAKTKPPARGISGDDYAANFASFLEKRPAGKPFCFWYGSNEPHRNYQFKSGAEVGGKSPADIDKVPGFWPDNETVRHDLLDYAFEIEHFDAHLGRMLAKLEEIGELDHTLVVVTSDNGMPFPRSKGAAYEYANHMPLAIMWPAGIAKPGRKITDYISFTDFAPTFLELAGVDPKAAGMQPIQGRSLTPLFRSGKNGRVESARDHVLLGQERHDVGRPGDVGYPSRSIIRDGMLYIHNFKPERWPMGNPETGYLNTDGSPTKTEVLNSRRSGENDTFWNLCFGIKGQEELYDVTTDPECLHNLIKDPSRRELAASLKEQLFTALKRQADPRMFGKGDIFDQYPYARNEHRDFHRRFMAGEVEKEIIQWANPDDFESRTGEEEKQTPP